MTPERWQQIESLYHAALERGPSERALYLSELCGADEELRREVESLLNSHEEADDFIEEPVVEEAARIFADNQIQSLVGHQIGHYRILSLIGAGGMGEVYLAQDLRLGRHVATKLLPSRFTLESDRVRRFEQEARAASALNHPNILTVYDIGEALGRHFIATEYIDGETLKERMTRESIKPGEALEIAIQAASALAAAHAAGIVHRDIKPENIMRRTDGYVKILDFGLAKLSEEPSTIDSESKVPTMVDTDPGTVMGTVRYMSPEQAQGLEVDTRTDIWSLGVVLYEMLAGCSPFDGVTPSHVIVSIIEKEPAPLVRYSAQVPIEMDWIVHKALRKDREERYQTARDLLNDLRRLKQQLEIDSKWEDFVRPGAGGPTPVAARAGQETSHGSPDGPTSLSRLSDAKSPQGKRRSRKAIDSLAILPLVNDSADPSVEYLSDGITESIINNLSQLPKLRVMARSTVFRYKGLDVDPQEVGHALSVRAVLTGRIVQQSERMIIKIELVDIADGSQLWGDQYNRNVEDIFAVQEEIATHISEKLRMRLSGEEKKRLAKRHTENTEAYDLYLRGRYYLNKRNKLGMEKGVEYFQKAIEIDPQYALAYAGLADTYNILGFYGLQAPDEVMPKAKAAAEKALEIDGQLAEAQISLAYVKGAYDWNWKGAEVDYKRAIALNMNYAVAHHWYGEFLAEMGRFDEAIAEIKRALKIDPLSLIINEAVGWIFYLARRYDNAIEQYRKTIELDPNFVQAHFCLGLAYVQKFKLDEAVAEFEKAIHILGRNSGALAALGYARAIAGEREEAQEILNELISRSERKYIAPYLIAMVCTGLGDKEQALRWLEKGFEGRDLGLVWLKVEPLADSLRTDRRFQDLLQRLGLNG